MRRSKRSEPSLLNLREALAWNFSPPIGDSLVEPVLRTITRHARNLIHRAEAHDLQFIVLDNDTDSRVACGAALELLSRQQLPANIRAGVLQRARYLVGNRSDHPVYREIQQHIRSSTF